MRVKVTLMQYDLVFQNYLGKLELAQPKEQSIREVMQGRPLYYKVHFPLPWPIPILTDLWFNDEHICSGPSGM